MTESTESNTILEFTDNKGVINLLINIKCIGTVVDPGLLFRNTMHYTIYYKKIKLHVSKFILYINLVVLIPSVMGTWSGSLGAYFLLIGWWVRAFGTSGLVDILSKCLYTQTINMSGSMYRRSHYIPFSSHLWLFIC